jgi:hypothetical protein
MLEYDFVSYVYLQGHSSQDMRKRVGKAIDLLTLPGHTRTIVWGAVSNDPFKYNIAQVIVVQEDGNPEYTVSVRGTNFPSIPSWLLEDFITGHKVPWDNLNSRLVKGSAGCGSVSLATATAMRIHLNLKDENNVGLFDYLDGILQANPSATINFTGHSLGGCVAPTLALKYFEHWQSDLQPKFGGTPQFSVYAFAGPTPGDQDFAAYMTNTFSAKPFVCHELVRSTLDVVPHAWNAQDMNDIYGIYEPQLKIPKLMSDLLTNLKKRTDPLGYLHSFPGFQSIKTGSTELLGQFGVDAITQKKIKPKTLKAFSLQKDALSAQGKSSSDVFAVTLVDDVCWVLTMACMHVLPYLALCFEQEKQRKIWEKILKPNLFKGLLD